MKIKHTKQLKNGKQQLIVEIDSEEKLMSIKGNCSYSAYRLAHHYNDVVHISDEEGSSPVVLCRVSQQ